MEKCILIVEDEKTIVDILSFNLKKAGYSVLEAYDGEEGLKLALTGRSDLILLDVMLPKMDGFDVCRRIREQDPVMPIIMLTAREEEADKVFGLELGADDYITKPFSMPELMARIKANIRRLSVPRPETDALREGDLVSGTLTINPDRQEVFKDNKPVELSKREFDLLLFLFTNTDRVFSREELMEKVWNYEYYGDLRAVDVAVRRLREKIELNPAEPEYILTKRGVGYLFAGRN